MSGREGGNQGRGRQESGTKLLTSGLNVTLSVVLRPEGPSKTSPISFRDPKTLNRRQLLDDMSRLRFWSYSYSTLLSNDHELRSVTRSGTFFSLIFKYKSTSKTRSRRQEIFEVSRSIDIRHCKLGQSRYPEGHHIDFRYLEEGSFCRCIGVDIKVN